VEAIDLAQGNNIGAVNFGCNHDPSLVQLSVIDKNQKLVAECKGNWPINYIETMKLAYSEHIVSANVEVAEGSAFAQNVQFIFFNNQ